MASSEPWESRPDNQATKGVGVLIDPSYLASPDKSNYENPYYVVVNGIRYYGPSPEQAVQKAREKAPRKVIPAVPTKQVASSLPSGRTMGARTRNAASRAAQGVKGVFSAAGKLFQKKPTTNTAAAPPTGPKGPTLKNKAAGAFSSMGTGFKSLGSKVSQALTRKAKASGPVTGQAGNTVQLQTNPLFAPGKGVSAAGQGPGNSLLVSASQKETNMRTFSNSQTGNSQTGGRRRRHRRKSLRRSLHSNARA